MATAPKTTSTETPLSGYDWPAIIKDLIGTAVITFLILTPIVSFRTILDQGVLSLTTRWPLALGLTLLVVVGRALLHLFLWKREGAPSTPSILPGFLSEFSSIGKYVGPALLVVAIILPLVSGGDKRTIDLAIYILTYVMLGWGLNIVVGLAGLLDLGYVAFYAVGAYSYALFAKFGLPFITLLPSYPFLEFDHIHLGPWAFWVLLPISGLLAAFWGLLLGFPVLRLRGDYLAIVTLAFGEIIRLVLINWVALTNGYAGVASIPRPTFFGIPFTAADDGFAAIFGLEFSPIYRTIFLYYLILALALLTAALTLRLRRLPVGRAWDALREDEIACRSLGINTTNTKLTAFATGAMFGGFAGAFFAARQGFISPESFVFSESAIILAIVVLGGMGSLIGVVIAAVVMIGGTELMRELGFLKAIFGQDFDPA